MKTNNAMQMWRVQMSLQRVVRYLSKYHYGNKQGPKGGCPATRALQLPA